MILLERATLIFSGALGGFLMGVIVASALWLSVFEKGNDE